MLAEVTRYQFQHLEEQKPLQLRMMQKRGTLSITLSKTGTVKMVILESYLTLGMLLGLVRS
jgi:hypothetical protein